MDRSTKALAGLFVTSGVRHFVITDTFASIVPKPLPHKRDGRGAPRTPERKTLWHDGGMTRIRLSTTVDSVLLAEARQMSSGTTDAVLIDAALTALLAHHRAAEIDSRYSAYDDHPISDSDEWGDLASFRQAAAAS